jgi:phosphoenolpyruvate synthase/pyruvate phosphate dikinase
MKMESKNLNLTVSVLDLDKLQNIIKVLRHWAEDERIPEDARQEMVNALNDAMSATPAIKYRGAQEA